MHTELEKTMVVSDSMSAPLGKYLASTDKRTRDKAIKQLSLFLSDSTRDAIPKPEMVKLWKGIFYCFWMSDKPLVQQALASELSELILTITTISSSLGFLRGFWETIVREWNGIDRLRLDKYYLLIRRFVNASFRLLIRTEWDARACEEYNSILTDTGGPLCPNDIRVPSSLALHLADIYLEELNKLLSNISLAAPLSILLSPFFQLLARTPTSTIYNHIQSTLVDPLLAALNPPSQDEPRSRKRMKMELPQYENIVGNACASDPRTEGKVNGAMLRNALLRQMLEIASAQDTRDANRRNMYAIWKEGADVDEDDT